MKIEISGEPKYTYFKITEDCSIIFMSFGVNLTILTIDLAGCLEVSLSLHRKLVVFVATDII